MDDLIKSLREFSTMPLKRGLQSEKVYEKEMAKMVNDTLEKGNTFAIAVEDLKHLVSGAKAPTGNSRFASERVISKFLTMNY